MNVSASNLPLLLVSFMRSHITKLVLTVAKLVRRIGALPPRAVVVATSDRLGILLQTVCMYKVRSYCVCNYSNYNPFIGIIGLLRAFWVFLKGFLY